MNEEIWKISKNSNYEVSNLGKIRNAKTRKTISFRRGFDGTLSVVFKGDTIYTVAELVLIAFVGEVKNSFGVLYKDGNKNNLNASNLSWDINSEDFIENINSYPGYFVSKYGDVFSKNDMKKGVQWKKLKPFQCRNGRMRVIIYDQRGKPKSVYTYILVLEAYRGPRPLGMYGCHNDGNLKNNHIDNLRWDTPKNNSADRKIHGTSLIGQDNKASKLSNNDIENIFNLRKMGKSIEEIASIYGIYYTTVYKIISGETWTHLNINRNEIKLKIPRRSLSDDQIKEAFHLKEEGFSHRQIGKKLNVSNTSINRIFNTKMYLGVKLDKNGDYIAE